MSIDCSCQGITTSQFAHAAGDNADAVRDAATLGRAAGVVFRATHPDGKASCETCIVPIAKIIVNEGLRPAAELDPFLKKRQAVAAKGGQCAGCTGGACKSFDFGL